MIRVGFVIGGYPPEEHKRRADVALSYSTAGNSSRDRRCRRQPVFLRDDADGNSAGRAGVYRCFQTRRKGRLRRRGASWAHWTWGWTAESRRWIFPSSVPPKPVFMSHRSSATDSESWFITRAWLRFHARLFGAMEWSIAWSASASAVLICRIWLHTMTKSWITLSSEAKRLVEQGAEVIYPMGISQCPVHIKADWLQEQLGVPVVEGIGTPIRMAALLAGLGLTQSRARWVKSRNV